jgi:hypothetical protein
MTKIKITSLAHDMVGNIATVRAEIMEDAGGFFRIKDTIELEVEGGARMTDAQIATVVRERYNG